MRAQLKRTTHGVGKRVVIIKAPLASVKTIVVELFGDVCDIETNRRACATKAAHLRRIGTILKRCR